MAPYFNVARPSTTSSRPKRRKSSPPVGLTIRMQRIFANESGKEGGLLRRLGPSTP